MRGSARLSSGVVLGGAIGMAIAGAAGVLSTAQAQGTPEDWPCVQVFVPELSLGILYPAPIEAEILDTWRDHSEVRTLAEALGGADDYTDALRERVAAYAETISDAERTEHVDRLAAGVFTVADRRRSDYLSDIRRYTRQQIAVAGQIESALNELAAAETAGDSHELADPNARLAFEESLRWHQRVFDERERVIPRLCERPVELEQTLSTILRDLAQYRS